MWPRRPLPQRWNVLRQVPLGASERPGTAGRSRVERAAIDAVKVRYFVTLCGHRRFVELAFAIGCRIGAPSSTFGVHQWARTTGRRWKSETKRAESRNWKTNWPPASRRGGISGIGAKAVSTSSRPRTKDSFARKANSGSGANLRCENPANDLGGRSGRFPMRCFDVHGHVCAVQGGNR
jgi:hypothetical protein